MAKIYSINRKDCTEEDFLYVAPVANAEGMWAAVVLFQGKLSPYFKSEVSLADAKAQGDAWIQANLNGATTSYRREM